MGELIKGVIESIEQKAGESASGQAWKRAAFTISGKKYSTFDEEIIKEFESGDNVEIEFKKSEDGKYSNIVSAKKSEPVKKTIADFKTADKVDSVPQSVWESKDRKIIRQSCLKAAIESLGVLAQIDLDKAKKVLGDNQLIDVIMDISSTFEDFVHRPMPGEA